MAAIGGLLVVAAVIQSRRAGYTQATPTPSVVKGNSMVGAPTPTPAPAATPTPAKTTATPAAPATPPPAPVLTKSSGNAPGSSVPAGAVVEFTCEDTAGLGCEVILTNRSNVAQVIALGKKTVADNGRGQVFAIWDWTSVRGSWNVAAKATDAAGLTTTSTTQTLEVK